MTEAPPKLYLVDAMSNIHRAYHAIRGLSTRDGRPTNAVYGFVTMLRKMVREQPSDTVVKLMIAIGRGIQAPGILDVDRRHVLKQA